MRKVFVILAVLTLLGCMALPAFAVGESGSDTTEYFAPLKLDVIEYYDTRYAYTMPYPFYSSWGNGEGSFTSFDLVTGTQTTFYDPYDRLFSRGDITFPFGSQTETSTLILKGGLQVCSLSQLEDNGFFLRYDSDILSVSRVYVGFHYVKIQEAEGSLYYSASTPLYYGNVGYVSGGYANIGAFIAGVRSSVPSDSICITDIEIRIDYIRTAVDTPHFIFESRLSPNSVTNPGPGFNSWFSGQRVPVGAEFDDFDMFEWLKNSLVSFMEFELIPGFSFSKIYVLILTIGVLMFFLHVVK